MRNKYSAERRAQLLAAYRSSGLSQHRFCREQKLSPKTLTSWLKATTVRFVKAAAPPPTPLVVAIHGATIRLERGFDAGLLRDVIAALRA